MAYDYDVDILALLWTGAEDGEEPYATILADNPALTDEISELRILSTIELLRSHMELLASREEANILHFAISRLIRHTAGGSNPFSDAAKVTGAEGNVKKPQFPAGATLDITIDGVTVSPASATGGDLDTVIAELNATAGGAGTPAAIERTSVDYAGVAGAGINGTYWTLNSANDATGYYVWHDVDAGGSDPAPGGLTGIPVSISSADADTAVRSAVGIAINANPDFATESGAGAILQVDNAATGPTTDAADVDSGVVITVTQQGASAIPGVAEVTFFKTFDGRLGVRAIGDFVTFSVSNGSGGVIGPAGIIPGPRLSKPAVVAQQGRDISLNYVVGTLKNQNGL